MRPNKKQNKKCSISCENSLKSKTNDGKGKIEPMRKQCATYGGEELNLRPLSSFDLPYVSKQKACMPSRIWSELTELTGIMC